MIAHFLSFQILQSLYMQINTCNTGIYLLLAFIGTRLVNPPAKTKTMDVLQIAIYVLTFAVIFWIFFKSVNYFEKI